MATYLEHIASLEKQVEGLRKELSAKGQNNDASVEELKRKMDHQ